MQDQCDTIPSFTTDSDVREIMRDTEPPESEPTLLNNIYEAIQSKRLAEVRP